MLRSTRIELCLSFFSSMWNETRFSNCWLSLGFITLKHYRYRVYNISFSLKVNVFTVCWSLKVQGKNFHVHFGYFEHCDNSNNLVIPLRPRMIEILLYLVIEFFFYLWKIEIHFISWTSSVIFSQLPLKLLILKTVVPDFGHGDNIHCDREIFSPT